jgi:hypothetical protein
MVSPKIAQEFVTKTIIPKVEEIIKSGKTTAVQKLLEKKKTPVKIGTKETEVVEGVETVTKITKKDIKVKKPEAISAEAADEALFQYTKGSKIPPNVLKNFNINRIKTKDDILRLIEITAKSIKGDRTRNVHKHELTKRLATLLNKNPENLQRTLLELKPGQTLNAEYILAARELLIAGMTKLDEMAIKITSAPTKVKPEEILAFRQHFALMGEFQKILKGVQTETARALQQFRIPARSKKYASVDLDELNKESLLIELGGADDIQAVAKLYITAGNQQAKLKFAQDVGLKANFKKASDSIAEVFLNVILSNPITHVRNTAGNWVTMGINNFERRVASKLHGGKDAAGLAEYEDIVKMYGKTMAAQEMKKAIAEAFRTKGFAKFFKEFDQNIASNFGGTSKIELHGRKLTAENFSVGNKFGATTIDSIGQLLTLGRVPTRFLTVMDNWFKNQEYRSELYAMAYREALQMYKEGWLKQNNIAAYIADRVVNPTKAIQKTAYDAAHYVTYQTKLSNQPGNKLAQFGNIIQKGKNKASYMSWLSNYYLPFVQTPTNIASFVTERTPILASLVSRYSAEIAAGGARAQMAKTRLQLGYMFYMAMGTAGYFGAASGTDINIPGATTGGKYELMKGFGYQPNSLRIPIGEDDSVQINLTGLDPFNLLIANAANTGQAINLALQSGADPHAQAAHLFALTYGYGELLSNSTFLMGVTNLAKDTSNFTKFLAGDRTNKGAQKWWNKFSSAFVPGLFKWVGKNAPTFEEGKIDWLNDDYRKIFLEWDEFMLRNINEENLQWDYDMYGNRIEKFGFLSFIKKTDVSRAVEEVMPNIRPIKDNIEYTYANGMSVQIPLKSDELRFYKKNAGINFVNRMKNEVFKNPLWKPETEEIVKKKLITKALSDARSDAKDQLLTEKYGFLENLQIRGDEIKNKKILSEQGGKPLIEDNLGFVHPKATKHWSNQ